MVRETISDLDIQVLLTGQGLCGRAKSDDDKRDGAHVFLWEKMVAGEIKAGSPRMIYFSYVS